MHLDTIQSVAATSRVVVRRDTRTTVSGWAFAQGLQIADPDTESYLLLRLANGAGSFFAPLLRRTERHDVSKHHPEVDSRFTAHAGFTATIWAEGVPPGEYELGVVQANGTRAAAGFCSNRVTVQ